MPPTWRTNPGDAARVPSTGCLLRSPPGTSGQRLPPASSLSFPCGPEFEQEVERRPGRGKHSSAVGSHPGALPPDPACSCLHLPHPPGPTNNTTTEGRRPVPVTRLVPVIGRHGRHEPPATTPPTAPDSQPRSQTTTRSSRTIHTSRRSAVTRHPAKTKPFTARSGDTPRPSTRTRRTAASIEPDYPASPQTRSAETPKRETAVARHPSNRTARPARTKEMRPARFAWRDPPVLD